MGRYTQSAIALVVLANAIVRLFASSAASDALCVASFLGLFCIVAIQGVPLAKAFLLLIAASIVAGYIFLPDFTKILMSAFAWGGDFAALFTALALLREPASQSETVQVAGASIVTQPPTRRAIFLSVATHGIAVVLHVGTLAMLGAMVKRGVSLVSHWSAQFREVELTRCTLAILRGSSSTTCWAPTSATVPLLLISVPGTSFGGIFTIGALAALVLLATAWLFDAFGYPRNGAGPHSPINMIAISRLTFIIATVVGGVITTSILGGFDIPHAVMVALPPLCLFWIAAQISRQPVSRAVTKLRFVNLLQNSIPNSMREIVLLGGVAFMSKIVIGANFMQVVGAGVGYMTAGAFLLPTFVFLVMLAAAWFGLPPIISLVFFTSVLGDVRQYGTPLEAMILAYTVGMALATQFCPATANVLMLSNIAETTPKQLIRQNAAYVGIVAAGSVATLTILNLLHSK